jgi:hypothetical protein
MEINYNPYTYEAFENYEMLYIFKTDFELLYEIRFKPTPYLFPKDKPYSKDTYEFSIIVLENPNHSSPPFDNRIGSTIAKIFDEFYEINGNTVSLYICASHDNRQFVRFRKFSAWFATFNNDRYFKIECPIKDSQGNSFPIALILKKGNPFRKDIISSFDEIIDAYHK